MPAEKRDHQRRSHHDKMLHSEAIDNFGLQARKVGEQDSAVSVHGERTMHFRGGVLPSLAVVLPPNYFQNFHSAIGRAASPTCFRRVCPRSALHGVPDAKILTSRYTAQMSTGPGLSDSCRSPPLLAPSGSRLRVGDELPTPSPCWCRQSQTGQRSRRAQR